MKYKDRLEPVPCEQCQKPRLFRYIKHSGKYKNYRPLCATCSGRSRKYTTKNNFNSIDTEEKSYAFGFFWADGCVNRYKTFTIRLQETDGDILDRFCNYFGGSRHRRKFFRADGRIYFQEEWIIHDMIWIEQLKSIGFRQHLNNIPSPLFYHFLRGLLDGDGHYAYRKNHKLNSINISSNYSDNFEWLTKYITIPYRISKNVSKRGSSSEFSLKGGDKILSEFVNKIYNNSKIYLVRKFNLNKHKIINND